MKNNEQKKLNMINVTTLLLIFLFMLFLNSKLDYFTDDWHFKFIFQDFFERDVETRVESLSDVITSVSNFYRLSGGRALAHFMFQAVMIFDKWLGNLINSLSFVALGWLLYLILKIRQRDYEEKVVINKGRWIEYIKLPVIFILLFMFIPSFGNTCLWAAGAANYLWTAVIVLIFVYLFFRHEIKPSTGLKIWMSVFAVLSGMTNETIGGMLVVFLVGRKILEKEKIRKWDIIILMCIVAGTLFLMLAPGNMNRSDNSDIKPFSYGAMVALLKKQFFWFFDCYYYVLMIPMIAACIIYRHHIKEFIMGICFCVAGIAGLFALPLSGSIVERAEFGNILFIIIAFSCTFCSVIELWRKGITPCTESQLISKIYSVLSARFKKVFTVVTILVCITGLICFFVINTVLYIEAADATHAQTILVEKAVEEGLDSIELPEIIYYDQGKFFPIEASCSKSFDARWKGMYYGIKLTYYKP